MTRSPVWHVFDEHKREQGTDGDHVHLLYHQHIATEKIFKKTAYVDSLMASEFLDSIVGY